MPAHWPPRVGDIVHYVAHGTPPRPDGSQDYPSVCRAAIVTAVDTYTGHLSLAVLNPTGMFFNQAVAHAAGDSSDNAPGARCHTGGRAYPGGSWHVPERGD